MLYLYMQKQNYNMKGKPKGKYPSFLFFCRLVVITNTSFLAAFSDQLVIDVQNIYNTYEFSDKEAFDSQLNYLGISVYPETAAGLTFIVKTRQLLNGYYAIMDIGGGSTDISFFYIHDGQNIRYLASESYMLAANNVYIKYAGETNSLIELQKAENEVRDIINNNNWKENTVLKSALCEVNNSLNKIVYKLFNKRVYYFNKKMIMNYTDQPIILYGGGIRLPVLNCGNIEIHDNGNKDSITIDRTYLEKQEMKKYASIINILPVDRTWEDDFPLLAVALGLSFIKHESMADWFNENDYKAKDGDCLHEIQHPFNEDCYIYDVLTKKWQ